MARRKRFWLIVALNLLVVAALLVGVEMVLRGGLHDPTVEARSSRTGPLFVPEPGSAPVRMVNNYHSEIEPAGAPMSESPPEGVNVGLIERVNDALTFPREKTPGRPRVFVLGTSPIWGFVGHRNTDHTLLALYLDDAIARRFPDADVEVVNAAHVGMGGDEVLRAMREVVEYEPDLVVVYFGGVMPAMLTDGERDDVTRSPGSYQRLRFLKRSRLFRLLRKLLLPSEASAQPAPPPDLSKPPRSPKPDHATPPPPPPPPGMDNSSSKRGRDGAGMPLFGPGSEPLEQPRDYNERMVNLVRNLKTDIENNYNNLFVAMAELLNQRGIAGAFFTVATNQADFPPFWSLHQKPLDDDSIQRFATILDQAREARERNDLQRARALYEAAVTLGPTFAAAHFELGGVYRALGERDGARAAFRAAKEWDASNERALDRPNRLLLEAAKAHGLATVDTEAILLSLPESDGYLGNGVFIDHQHMNPRGVAAMGDAVAARLPEVLPNFRWAD